MKYQPFLSAAVSFGLLFTVAACNNSGESSSSTEDTNATTSTTTTAATPASTTITTPQELLVIKHKVANYAKWKMAYDGHDSARLAAGVHNYVIGRGLQDSNMVMIALKIDDTARAMAFSKDAGLKQAMQKGGVMGTPMISFVTMTFQDTATISSTLRSSSMFTVKDWDTWLKNFEEGSQERKDNGLTVRAYGHESKDNHKVRVVTALVDSAKAMSYFKSDMLKKRMSDAGMEGTPDRFLYRIVQRY